MDLLIGKSRIMLFLLLKSHSFALCATTVILQPAYEQGRGWAVQKVFVCVGGCDVDFEQVLSKLELSL